MVGVDTLVEDRRLEVLDGRHVLADDEVDPRETGRHEEARAAGLEDLGWVISGGAEFTLPSTHPTPTHVHVHREVLLHRR